MLANRAHGAPKLFESEFEGCGAVLRANARAAELFWAKAAHASARVVPAVLSWYWSGFPAHPVETSWSGMDRLEGWVSVAQNLKMSIV